jgi:hypothetical protein
MSKPACFSFSADELLIFRGGLHRTSLLWNVQANKAKDSNWGTKGSWENQDLVLGVTCLRIKIIRKH